MRKFAPLILEPLTQPATRACIFSHGLGDTAHGWIDVLRDLQQQPRLATYRFILPTAPIRPVTINGGMPCPFVFSAQTTREPRAPKHRES